MSLEALVSKYVGSAEHVLSKLRITETSSISKSEIAKVVESAKAYLADAKYYRDEKKFEVSLASVCYCEGLLDALKMLRAVKFEWPAKRKQKSEK